MQHFRLRCKHCYKEYVYCTYGNGPEYGTEAGCSREYCAECQKAIDDALGKIQGRGYAYYYDSVYNTNQTISRIKNRQGVNCTDSAQLTYRIALALGYTCQFVHVRCVSGTGHVRLRLKGKGSSDWFYRDPSAILDGNSVTYNWCSNGTVLAYNPAWVLSDVME